MAEEFDPAEHTAAEVKEELDKAAPDEAKKIAGAEASGKGRKTVLEAAGLDPNSRYDVSGRQMHPWEVSPRPKNR